METSPLHHKLRLAAAVSLSGLVFYAATTATVRAAAPPAKKTAPKAAVKKTTAPKPTSQTNFTDNTPLTEQQKIVHLLNRAAFGPRPGDVERVKQMGMAAYIDEQLHPERIPDGDVAAKISSLTILQMPSEELTRGYFDAIQRGKELKNLQARIERQSTSQGAGDGGTMEMTPGEAAAATPEKKRQKLQAALQNMTPEERMRARELMVGGRGKAAYSGTPQLIVAKTIRAVESQRQLQEVMVDFWTNHFNIDARKNTCRVYKVADDRDVIQKHTFARFRDLLGASAKSPAMLVYLDNAQSSGEQTPDPRVLQRQTEQRQRLENMAARGNLRAKQTLSRLETMQKAIKKRKPAGLNENYAREIMELHTLGVDGGYTQKDVTEVARCLTGWTVDRATGSFRFDPRRHDNGDKIVLGQVIPAGGGMADGEKVLDILAGSPATMRHVSYKLCQRLVADEPPAALVNKCVTTWKKTSGDIREVVRTILTAPEFNSRVAYRQKIKSPFEYAVSSARAVGATYVMDAPQGRQGRQRPMQAAAAVGMVGQAGNAYTGNANMQFLPGQVAVMGQPLFQYQAPTGYPEDSRKWVSSGALISRLNFSLALTRGNIRDLNLSQMQDTLLRGEQNVPPAQYVSRLADTLLSGEVSPSTRATLLKEARALTERSGDVASASGAAPAGTDRETAQKLAALVLGSPEFQRR
jgi:uncharacterized protein (DUF1800 family)